MKHGLTTTPEGIHHKACTGDRCVMFGCETLSNVLRGLHHSDCTFWACPGAVGDDIRPMQTCNVHGLYFELLNITKGAEIYCRCEEPEFTRANPGKGDWLCVRCERFEMPKEDD